MIITDLGRLRERPTQELRKRGWLEEPLSAIYRIAGSDGGAYSLTGINEKLDLAYGVADRLFEEKLRWHTKAPGAPIEYGVAYGRLRPEVLPFLRMESAERKLVRARGQAPQATLAESQAAWALDGLERALIPGLEAFLRPL